MSKLAVDVVLVPPKEIINLAVQVNGTLDPRTRNITLGEDNCIPHISLCFGVMKEADAPAVFKLVEKIAKENKPLRLRIPEARTIVKDDGRTLSVFSVEVSPQLQSLHETITNSFEHLFSSSAEPEMFFEPPDKHTLEVVRTYRQRSFQNFHPHITLGAGALKSKTAAPISFVGNTLGLCHTGAHGTCAKLLFSTKLGKE